MLEVRLRTEVRGTPHSEGVMRSQRNCQTRKRQLVAKIRVVREYQAEYWESAPAANSIEREGLLVV